MIKAIIFDFGGVLVRTEDYGPRLAWDKRLGLPPGSVERAVHHSDLWVRVQLGRISSQAYWDGVAELLYMRDASIINELRRDYFSGDRLDDTLVDLIRDLRAAGYCIVLLSNDSAELVDKLRELAIDSLFDHILISAQTGVMKPDVTAYRVALQAAQASPDQAIFVDDSYVNIQGAQSLGIHSIWFQADKDIRAEVTRLLEDTAGE